jgi:DNA-directed RNA polymerase specialized sigma24 family protein
MTARAGIRWERRDDMDAREAPAAEFRSELLRELVDKLPAKQRHMVGRTIFGGASMIQAAKEIGEGKRSAEKLYDQGIATIRKALLRRHKMGTLPAELLGAVAAGVLPKP